MKGVLSWLFLHLAIEVREGVGASWRLLRRKIALLLYEQEGAVSVRLRYHCGWKWRVVGYTHMYDMAARTLLLGAGASVPRD